MKAHQDFLPLVKAINSCAKKNKPFLFIIDFDCEKPIVRSLDEIDPDEILYNFNGFSNYQKDAVKPDPGEPFSFKKFPISFDEYKKRFDIVREHLLQGNSYLVNLTLPTPIETSLTLREIFIRSKAPYKLLYTPKGGTKFVVFSPELFVRIEDEVISTYPMKGTINDAIPGAEKIIIEDKKELAEHSTIVDLLRNDLGRVAHDVELARFRYIDRIKTYNSELLQVSSEIKGKVNEELLNDFGQLLALLLPAGSISGAPKHKTIEIIKEAEQYDRGYYTGVFGYCNGTRLESAVMIRFIEEDENNNKMFKSGGGVTIYSDPKREYEELIDKVYVPFN